MPLVEMSKITGLTINALYAVALDEAGFRTPSTTELTTENVVELREMGMSWREIAAHTGSTRNDVRLR
jgi:hypothetical protein